MDLYTYITLGYGVALAFKLLYVSTCHLDNKNPSGV